MKVSTLVVLLALLAISFSVSAGVITSDPNEPGAQVAMEDKANLNDDPRLNEKITFEATDQPIAATLQSISKASGISFVPSSAPDNWQVRERTAIVFMSDAPVSEFKEAMAELFDYRWTRANTEQPWTYLLRETDRAKMVRQGLIDQKQQEEIQQRLAGIQNALGDAEKSIGMTPQEIQQARDTNPWLYYLATNPSGKLWAEFIQEVPVEWWDEVALGKIKSVHLDPNSSHLMDIVRQILQLPASAVSDTDRSGESQTSIQHVNVHICPGAPSNGVFAPIIVQLPGVALAESFPVGSATSSTLLRHGMANLIMEEGKDWQTAREETPSSQKFLDCIKSAELQKQGHRTEQDAELLVEIEHKPIADETNKDEDFVVRHLRGLSRETGYTIVWETFDRPRRDREMSLPEKCTVQRVLSVLVGPYSTFERRGNVIYVRHKEWAEQRALEIPQDLTTRWVASARAHDGLDFEDLYDIARHTTREQVEHTLMKNKLLKAAGLDYLLVIHDILRHASMLPETQSKLYRSETGVPARVIRDSLLNSTSPEDRESLAGYQKLVDKDPDTLTGMSCAESGDNNSGHRYSITFFTKYSDGKVSSFSHKYRSKEEISAFRAIVKQIEEAKLKPDKESAPTSTP